MPPRANVHHGRPRTHAPAFKRCAWRFAYRGTGGLHAKVGWLIPEAALRLASLLTAMEAIESELGPLMDKTEPIPPVFPQEPAD